jgi:N-formylglutamate amidohydrolase
VAIVTVPPPPAHSAPFERLGPAVPASPVVVSVPHAGRLYPPAMLDALRLPLAALLPLEDRHVDALARAACADEALFVALGARAWIDLNRAEHERDPLLDDGANPGSAPIGSTKVRSGLGLVPRRIGGADIWRRRLGADEVAARIVRGHRPYHAALRAALEAARDRFGVAVLLDLHSMPPIGGRNAARVVIGDRFGRSAAARFVGRVEGVVRGRGLTLATNSPYPGGHILDRHADPARGIHALQLELDRALYLDAALEEIGRGFAATVALVRAVIDALADEALPLAQAAE